MLGFAAGVYFLPILTAPPAASLAHVKSAASGAKHVAVFKRDLPGSDALHWGEGRLSLAPGSVAFEGRMAPGPAYKLYLVPGKVETAEAFLKVKDRSVAIADVKSFENFVLPIAPDAPIERYETAVIWCEAFSQFITSGKYR